MTDKKRKDLGESLGPMVPKRFPPRVPLVTPRGMEKVTGYETKNGKDVQTYIRKQRKNKE